MTNEAKDIYSQVAQAVIADLEKGVRTWLLPWANRNSKVDVSLPVRHDGNPYRGINVLLLWREAVERGFSSPIWVTYKQARFLGAQVRKGQHGTPVFFARPVTIPKTNEAGQEIAGQTRLLHYYTVFNIEQINGLSENCLPKLADRLPTSERLDAAEAFVRATKAIIQHSDDPPSYAAISDIVQMPPLSRFECKETYFSILLRELIHWSGHWTRLDRGLGKQEQPDDKSKGTEELVAKFGAAILSAELGIAPEFRDDREDLLGQWLSILREDNRAIVRAAAEAQRAVDYLKTLQPQSAVPGLEKISNATDELIADAPKGQNSQRLTTRDRAQRPRRAQSAAPSPA